MLAVLFFQLFRQPFVFLSACSYQDRSTELDPLQFFCSLLIITIVVTLSAFFTVIILSPYRLCNARLSPGDRLSFGLFIGCSPVQISPTLGRFPRPLIVEPVVPMLI